MSACWPGYLGFSQPLDWTFDQYNESSYGSLTAIDYVNVSGTDYGVKKLDSQIIDKDFWIKTSNLGIVQSQLSLGLLSWDSSPLTIPIVPGAIEATISLHLDNKIVTDSDISLSFGKNGFTLESIGELQKYFAPEVTAYFSGVIKEIGFGVIGTTLDIKVLNNDNNKSLIKVTINFPKTEYKDYELGSCIEFEFEISFKPLIPVPELELVLEECYEIFEKSNKQVVGVVIFVLIILLLIEVIGVEAIAGIMISVISKLQPV